MKEQYLITDISVMVVDRNPCEYGSPIQFPIRSVHKRTTYSDAIAIDRQIIRLEEFHTPEGQCLIVGMTKDVEKFLGFPMSCYNDMQSEINQLNKQKDTVFKKLRDVRSEVSTFWGWIKWRWARRKNHNRIC